MFSLIALFTRIIESLDHPNAREIQMPRETANLFRNVVNMFNLALKDCPELIEDAYHDLVEIYLANELAMLNNKIRRMNPREREDIIGEIASLYNIDNRFFVQFVSNANANGGNHMRINTSPESDLKVVIERRFSSYYIDFEIRGEKYEFTNESHKADINLTKTEAVKVIDFMNENRSYQCDSRALPSRIVDLDTDEFFGDQDMFHGFALALNDFGRALNNMLAFNMYKSFYKYGSTNKGIIRFIEGFAPAEKSRLSNLILN